MRRALALLATALVLAPGQALAQSTLDLKIESVDHHAYPRVTVTVSVPGTLVEDDLLPGAFTITENGEGTAPSIRRLPTDDLDVVLVLDLSESMAGPPLAAAKEAAQSFTSQLPNGVNVAVVGFSAVPTVVSEFSDDTAAVSAAIGQLTTSGETALYDGLILGAGLFQSRPPGRRSVVLLSDGADTVSAAGLEEAIVAALAANAGFYAVELQSPEVDPVPLQRLAAATAGTVVSADDPDALAGIFDEIGAALVNRYELTYTSTHHGLTRLLVTISSGTESATASSSAQFPAAPPPEPAPVRQEPPPPSTIAPLRQPQPAPPPGPLGERWALYTGLGALGLALFGLTWLSLTRDAVGGKRFRIGLAPSSSGRALTDLTNRATLFAERTLQRRGQQRGLGATLERSGVTLRPGEFLVLAGSAGLVGFAVGTLTSGVVVGTLLAATTPLAARLLLQVKATRRKAAFAEQLGDNLQLIAGGLLAGHGLLQSIDAVTAEALSPSAEEFRRVVVETHLGRDFGEALRAMADRIGGEDFRWVVDAIEIHREIGGDLAEILQTVAETIRDRSQIQRRIKTLSAEGRLSGGILMFLPFAVALMVSVTNPGYMSELTGSAAGKMMIMVGLAFMTAGAVWIRRIVRLKF